MICDEAQKIKNPNAMVTRAAKKQKARLKIACTGTPVENTLTDLWCLFDFAQPGSAVTILLVESANIVRIQVENKGKTLAPDITASLFSSMVSSRREGTDHGSHLGLGLFIVRLIAEFHDGTVTAQNLADGSGVRFAVSNSASPVLPEWPASGLHDGMLPFQVCLFGSLWWHVDRRTLFLRLDEQQN